MKLFKIGAAAVLTLAATATAITPANAETASQVCPSGYVCLYEHRDFGGRMLKWNLPGEKKLEDWGFRDKASSIRDKRAGSFRATNVLGAWPDQHKTYNGDYELLGSWNDKIDKILLP
ncbi:peptidase inhibitor family I36 protein [Allokutzneria sp. NRRL B-24872]|uniref:peptidase inhibitor family I36 protein n=1 Tax=Allokutzneria sp. NRRL B-24872 TaxID=1137961 RepID=UPI000A3A9DA5|nr:peptidase inhibitor family I36 protein [Allokutzneria sp. NRRL B-24872]